MTLQRARKSSILISFLAFPFTFVYMSPYLALMGSSVGVVSSGLAFWGMFLAGALLFGRSGCGWVCPLGGLQDAVDAAVRKPAAKVRYLRFVKWLIWAPWFFGILVLTAKAGGWHKIDLMFNVEPFPPYARDAYFFYILFVCLAAVPAFLMGRRSFCHYFCFFSPLNIVGTRIGRLLRFPVLGIKVSSDISCRQCGACDDACPMGLNVSDMAKKGRFDHVECISCGQCSETCKSGILDYGFFRSQ